MSVSHSMQPQELNHPSRRNQKTYFLGEVRMYSSRGSALPLCGGHSWPRTAGGSVVWPICESIFRCSLLLLKLSNH